MRRFKDCVHNHIASIRIKIPTFRKRLEDCVHYHIASIKIKITTFQKHCLHKHTALMRNETAMIRTLSPRV